MSFNNLLRFIAFLYVIFDQKRECDRMVRLVFIQKYAQHIVVLGCVLQEIIEFDEN